VKNAREKEEELGGIGDVDLSGNQGGKVERKEERDILRAKCVCVHGNITTIRIRRMRGKKEESEDSHPPKGGGGCRQLIHSLTMHFFGKRKGKGREAGRETKHESIINRGNMIVRVCMCVCVCYQWGIRK